MLVMNDLQKLPSCFWIFSVLALLWNLMGLIAFIYDLTITPDTLANLPEKTQELYSLNPTWNFIPYAMATVGGVMASVCLLLRKLLAVPLFLISLLGVLVQQFYGFFVIKIYNYVAIWGIVLPFFVLVIALVLYFWSKRLALKQWIV